MSKRALALAAGLSAGVIYDIESGRIESPRIETLERIAAALGVTLARAAGEHAAQPVLSDVVEVVGTAALEPWLASIEWPPGRRYDIAATPSRLYPKARRFGLLVGDAHCAQVAAAGALLFAVPPRDAGRPLRTHDLVIVRDRQRSLERLLCMRLTLAAAGELVLVNPARDPALAQTVVLADADTVLGLVCGSIE